MNKSLTAFTTNHLAELLSMSPRTLERWRILGKGPSFRKLGSRVVYFENDLKTWLDGQVYTSTTDYHQRNK